MAVTQRKVLTNDIEIGMFVCNLDRPWCDTPFPIQGFYVESSDDITKLTHLCDHVYIDVQRARNIGGYAVNKKSLPKSPSINNVNSTINVCSYDFIRNTYAVANSAKKEMSHAKKIQREVYSSIDSLMSSARCNGKVDIERTQQVATHMVDSVLRNPDAFIWLSRMKVSDALSYSQSVNASIWGIVFGRHLGLKKPLLESLAMGLLLAKVGKVRLAKHSENHLSYVEDSLDILKHSPGISKQTLTVVAYHQEKLNGSGFPRGKRGEEIPIIGRIAGLVNYYEEKTNPLDGDSMGSSEAMSLIYKNRNRLFQQDLVEEFIKAIGVYPVGTIVELTNNEVGVVMEHNPDRKLHPKVMVVLNAKKRFIRRKVIRDLLEERNTQTTNPLSIRRTVPSSAVNIDFRKLQISGEKSRWGLLGLLGF